jgi:hypothetical protein
MATEGNFQEIFLPLFDRIRAHKSAIMCREIQYLGLVYFRRDMTEDRRG